MLPFIDKFPFFIDGIRWVDLIDIFIVFLIMYYIYKAISKTKAFPVLQGFGFILITLFIAAAFELNTLKSLLERVVSPMLLSIVILFPAEIRRGLYMIGKRIFFIKKILKQEEKIKDVAINAIEYLSKNKTGSLIVIQRNDSLQSVVETGTEIHANLDPNLLIALFQKSSPLHDGAVVISQNQIIAAACFITNLSSQDVSKRYGTRHRAALGLSESSDAITIITSEEKGTISLAWNSTLHSNLSLSKLEEFLNSFLYRQ